jgi:cysteine desulfurase/selenocysteine lyase
MGAMADALPQTAQQTAQRLDVTAVRRDFPALDQRVRGRPLVYLDSAATSQKPRAVIEAVSRFYAEDNANVHRGVHALSERATAALEAAREKVRRFIGAAQVEEIVFVRGATEAINLVAQTFGRARVRPGDEVLVTALEHHSNLVPWQVLCAQAGAKLRVADVDERGELRLDQLERLFSPRTRLLATTHLSNALGTIVPLAQVVELAHARGVPVLADGAQAAPHLPVDVRRLGCDFYVFSGHKLYAPMGIGVLYGRAEILDEMPPWQTGGEMVSAVSFEKASWQRPPFKFEAGTPDVAGAVGLGAALDYLQGLGWQEIAAHERELFAYGLARLAEVPGLRLIGGARQRACALPFVLGEIHPHDVGTLLDLEGVAVRTGHHCAQPLLRRLGLTATVRASLALYNRREDVDALVAALHKARETFA